MKIILIVMIRRLFVSKRYRPPSNRRARHSTLKKSRQELERLSVLRPPLGRARHGGDCPEHDLEVGALKGSFNHVVHYRG